MKSTTKLFLGIAVVAVTAIVAPQAHAGFIVTMYSPDDPLSATNPVVVTDGGALDSEAAGNEIGYFGAVGTSFPITLTVSSSNSPGDPTGAQLQITSIVVSNSAAVTKHLLIDVTSTDFTSPSGLGLTLTSLFSGNAALAVGVDANFQSAADPNNNQYGNDLFATAALPPSTFSAAAVHTALQDEPLTTDGAFATPTQTNTFGATDYSLSNFMTLTMAAGSQLNVSGTTSVNNTGGLGRTPEPASLAILALGAAAMLRRRR